MKSLEKYIIEKMVYTKNTNIVNKLNLNDKELQYIDALLFLANNDKNSKELVKTIYDVFISKETIENHKELKNFKENLFRYLNAHIELDNNEFDEIYKALRSIPEDELIKYRKNNNE
jgi:mannitol/fructose-specific phosphotransferase system IIA component (Ntr-type)